MKNKYYEYQQTRKPSFSNQYFQALGAMRATNSTANNTVNNTVNSTTNSTANSTANSTVNNTANNPTGSMQLTQALAITQQLILSTPRTRGGSTPRFTFNWYEQAKKVFGVLKPIETATEKKDAEYVEAEYSIDNSKIQQVLNALKMVSEATLTPANMQLGLTADLKESATTVYKDILSEMNHEQNSLRNYYNNNGLLKTVGRVALGVAVPVTEAIRYGAATFKDTDKSQNQLTRRTATELVQGMQNIQHFAATSDSASAKEAGLLAAKCLMYIDDQTMSGATDSQYTQQIKPFIEAQINRLIEIYNSKQDAYSKSIFYTNLKRALKQSSILPGGLVSQIIGG